MINIRQFILGLGAVASLASLASFTTSVQAQAFPSKPVTLLVPYPAGGLSDVIARTVNAPLGKALGQPVIVEGVGESYSYYASFKRTV